MAAVNSLRVMPTGDVYRPEVIQVCGISIPCVTDDPSGTFDIYASYDHHSVNEASTTRPRYRSESFAGHSLLTSYVPRVTAVTAAEHETASTDTSSTMLNFIKAIQEGDASLEPFDGGEDGRRAGKLAHGWEYDDKHILRRMGKVWVPRCPALRDELLMRNHDLPGTGHIGAFKTTKTLEMKYYWKGLHADCTAYVRECDVCQRNVTRRHKPYGEMAPLLEPVEALRDFSMDFIVGLPPSMSNSGQVCDSICVIVDRLTKLARYMPVPSTIDAPALADLWYREIVTKYGTPKSFVTDRDSRFTSVY